MSRGLGISQGTGLPFWAACEIAGAGAAFATNSQHPGFASVARQAATPAGGYDLTLSEPLAAGAAIGSVGIISESLANPFNYSITRVSDTVWRVRTWSNGALADANFYFELKPTSPVG